MYAGISQWDWHADNLVRRAKSLKIGTDRTVKMTGPTAVAIYNGGVQEGLGSFVGRRNLMCRLNLNDHSNRIDGKEITGALTSLAQNYPNPFKGSTQIGYELASASDVWIEVMDMTGRKVLTINDGRKPAGRYTVQLNAAGLEPGIYFYTLTAGTFRDTREMVVH